MNISNEMVHRAMDEMDRRLMRNEWVDGCELARHLIAFDILNNAINGLSALEPSNPSDQGAGLPGSAALRR